MAKGYKIKRGKLRAPSRAKPHPLFIATVALALAALAVVGYLSYEPVYNAIMGRNAESEPSAPPSQMPSEPEAVSGSAPEPAPELESEPEPGPLRAVYLPPELAGNSTRLQTFLDTHAAGETPVNTVLVDIKDKQGRVLFATRNELAAQAGAVVPEAIDLRELAQTLRNSGLGLAVRLSAFSDAAAAHFDSNMAVQYRAPGTLWLDNFPEQGGKPWLNPYSEAARGYIAELALEAAECGARYIMLDDCQFPPNSLTSDAFFGETGALTRAALLAGFVSGLEERLAEQGAACGVYVTAAALAAGANETIYGGEPVDILGGRIVLGCLPYQFPPEGYDTGGLQIKRPLENPDLTVRQAAAFAAEKLPGVTITALVQGGNEPEGVSYLARQLMRQADELARLGIEEYILYCSVPEGYLMV